MREARSPRGRAFVAAVLCAALALPGRAGLAEEGLPCESADTSVAFADEPTRQQCPIGCCHAFAAVALLESAIFRHYKKGIRLSEADLFVQKHVLPALRNKVEVPPRVEALIKEECPSPDEFGGNIEDDVELVLEKGIALGEVAEFRPFAEAYGRFKDAKKLDRFDAEAALVGEELFPPAEPQRPRAPGEPGPALQLGDPQSQARGLSRRPPAPKAKLAPLEERLARLYASRKAVRELVSGMKLEKASLLTKGWPGAWSQLYADPAACSEHGRLARRWLTARLCAGIPAGVSMNLGGLGNWGAFDYSASHAFVITGFEARGGALVFRTRNSWGGINPEVREDQLCRISDGHTVATPKEVERGKVVPVAGTAPEEVAPGPGQPTGR